MKLTILGLLLSIPLASAASDKLSALIIPEPTELTATDGTFTLNKATTIIASTELASEASLLRDALAPAMGFQLKTGKSTGSQITLELDSTLTGLGSEGYSMEVTKSAIAIKALSPTGIFYGTQSLLQLLPAEIVSDKPSDVAWTIPTGSITDSPRFAWRAFMLDEARQFKGEAEVLKLLDQMAALKMNVFHWHLTDDQGWRIEIKKYPKLTEVGSKRSDTQIGGWNSTKYSGEPHGGFYTQEQIKSIVAYAKARHITIVPEIGMPGHACAAIAAYPWLGTKNESIEVPSKFGKHYHTYNPASEKVYSAISDIFDEIVELFPSKIIHIGGDEVRFNHWKESAEVKALMEKENLNSMADVQIYFTNRVAKIVESKGRNIMGWNEIMGVNVHGGLNGGDEEISAQLSPDTIVHFWKGSADLAKQAVKDGHKIVNSWHSFTYLDYGYGGIPLRKAYDFDPVLDGLTPAEEKQIIGYGCQMWGEWIPTVEGMEQKVYPRIAAYSEVGWTQKANKDFKSFQQRMNKQFQRWDIQQIGYSTDTGSSYTAQDFFNHVQIATWTPKEISQTWKSIEFPTKGEIKGSGTYEVVFLHQKGKNAININEVSLLENGQPVATDKHKATSGKKLSNVVFKLDLSEFSTGSTYSVRANIKGSGGTNTTGEIKIRAAE